MSDLDALVGRLTFAGAARVYKFGEVPPRAAYPYLVVSPAPGAPTVRTLDGSGDPMGRFVVQHFARGIETLTEDAALTFLAFEGVELDDIEGAPVAWQEVATSPYRDPDTQGVLTIMHTYRF